jgi:hypothetical protein
VLITAAIGFSPDFWAAIVAVNLVLLDREVRRQVILPVPTVAVLLALEVLATQSDSLWLRSVGLALTVFGLYRQVAQVRTSASRGCGRAGRPRARRRSSQKIFVLA